MSVLRYTCAAARATNPLFMGGLESWGMTPRSRTFKDLSPAIQGHYAIWRKGFARYLCVGYIVHSACDSVVTGKWLHAGRSYEKTMG